MRYIIQIFLVGFLLINAESALAQRKGKSGGDEQTVQNAEERKRAQLAEREAQYNGHREHLKDIQTKKTQKRMKKNMKRAKKISQGRDIPWHKRLFRKRRV